MTVIQAKPGQALLLWNLLITGEEPAISKAKPELKPAERKSLIEAGLIQLEKRGRSQHLVLTDKAWDWAVENFDVVFAKTPAASPILQKLLLLLGQHLQSHHVSLSSFLRPDSQSSLNVENLEHEKTQPGEPSGVNSEMRSLSSNEMQDRISQAYTAVAKSSHESRVRLSKLRQHLTDLPQVAIDQTLCEMELAGKLILMPLEDPTEINPEDEQAVLDIDGYKCHIVYMKR
jgi:hypothetical protein